MRPLLASDSFHAVAAQKYSNEQIKPKVFSDEDRDPSHSIFPEEAERSGDSEYYHPHANSVHIHVRKRVYTPTHNEGPKIRSPRHCVIAGNSDTRLNKQNKNERKKNFQYLLQQLKYRYAIITTLIPCFLFVLVVVRVIG